MWACCMRSGPLSCSIYSCCDAASLSAYGSRRHLPITSWQSKKEQGIVYRWVCTVGWHQLEQMAAAFQTHSWVAQQDGKSSGRTFGAIHWVVHFVWIERWWEVQIYHDWQFGWNGDSEKKVWQIRDKDDGGTQICGWNFQNENGVWKKLYPTWILN